jgi:hypothetical protein
VSIIAGLLAAAACSSSTPGAAPDARPIPLGDAATGPDDAGGDVADKMPVDGGFATPDGGVVRADRFVTRVVSFTPGECAGFGIPDMPGIVEGPPVGGGEVSGSLDVVSLGRSGEIVLSFEPNAIVDGPGVDFLVFENSFWPNGDSSRVNAELGEVSVSDDGTTWKTFPCAPASMPPYGACASPHVVYASPGNGISPVDPTHAGGDPYDLADVGLTHARYVRIRDIYAGAGTIPCPDAPPKPTKVGFDLDAVAIVNAEMM